MIGKERLACIHRYRVTLAVILRVFISHVELRRLKRDHYRKLHARVCAAALLPMAIERMSAHCQVKHPARVPDCFPSAAAAAALILLSG